MGTAWIEVTESLHTRLVAEFSHVVTIVYSAMSCDRHFLARVRSPLLADDCRGVQEIVVDSAGVRFKPWADTG